MYANNPNITQILNEDFINSLKRTSFVQKIQKSGHLIIDYDPIKFPLETRSFEIAHLRFASTGVLSLFSS